jgi:single-strand DNA-binding protein
VTTFNIATDEQIKDKNSGKYTTRTEWSNIVAFGKLAEIAGEYVKAGDPLRAIGRLRTESWKDQESGKKLYRTRVVVDELFFLSPNSKQGYAASENGGHADELMGEEVAS